MRKMDVVECCICGRQYHDGMGWHHKADDGEYCNECFEANDYLCRVKPALDAIFDPMSTLSFVVARHLVRYLQDRRVPAENIIESEYRCKWSRYDPLWRVK